MRGQLLCLELRKRPDILPVAQGHGFPRVSNTRLWNTRLSRVDCWITSVRMTSSRQSLWRLLSDGINQIGARLRMRARLISVHHAERSFHERGGEAYPRIQSTAYEGNRSTVLWERFLRVCHSYMWGPSWGVVFVLCSLQRLFLSLLGLAWRIMQMDLLTYGILFVCMTLANTYGVAFAYRKVKESLRHKFVCSFLILYVLHLFLQ